jgi:NAD(P)-dependent dehydrogenase (short-subunit alcohol dehydrogenase family)
MDAAIVTGAAGALGHAVVEEFLGQGRALPSVIDTPAKRTWMSAGFAARAVAPSAIAKVIAFLRGADAALISGAMIPVHGDA